LCGDMCVDVRGKIEIHIPVNGSLLSHRPPNTKMSFIVTLSQGILINTAAPVLLDDPVCSVNHSLGRC
jgi:hypothetical protein